MREHLAEVPPGALVLVACSGGPDSLALLAGAVFEAPKVAVRVGAGIAGDGQAVRVREHRARMAVLDVVVRAFLAVRVARHATRLAEALELRLTPGDDLVHVCLMPRVPQDRIGGRLEHAVERQRQLDCSEVAAQVAGVLGNRLHDEVANLTSEIRELGKAQFAKVGGLPDVLQRHGGLTLPAGAGSCRHSGQPGTKATDVPR